MPFQKLSYVEPMKLYLALREFDMPFLLRSAEKDDRKARYTYASASPEFVVEINRHGTFLDGKEFSRERSPFNALKSIGIERFPGSRFLGGFVGYISYDAVANYIGGEMKEPSVFGYYPWSFIYDHLSGELYFFSLRDPPFNPQKIVEKARREHIIRENGGSEKISEDAPREKFEEMVRRGKEHIFAGDIFQVVLSREYRVKSELTPMEVYLRLVDINPSPYTFLLEFQKAVVGASPETLCSVEGNMVRINPIAGTAPRGKSREEDEKLRTSLLADEKERAEHVMLVDLARNDVRKVAKAVSVKLLRFFDVLRYSHVQHIESEVVGELREDKDAFDAVEAAFPAGTLTGAPKLRAMEIIRELEGSNRGIYGGAVGYFSVTGDADFAIGIRMTIMENGVAQVRAGAGIVADSQPHREYLETENKMRAILAALGVRK